MKAGALVLAAGRGSRFGAPKQLLEFGGVSLLDRACLAASEAGCHPVLRVLGAHAAEIASRGCPSGVETLHHLAWAEGMGSSLAAGMRRLLELSPDVETVFILLADQPMADTGLLRRMGAELERPGISIVLCDYGAAAGPPALFAAEHFTALAELSGDQGAKALASRHPSSIAKVSFPEGAWDIDSREIWERFTRARAASSEPRCG